MEENIIEFEYPIMWVINQETGGIKEIMQYSINN